MCCLTTLTMSEIFFTIITVPLGVLWMQSLTETSSQCSGLQPSLQSSSPTLGSPLLYSWNLGWSGGVGCAGDPPLLCVCPVWGCRQPCLLWADPPDSCRQSGIATGGVDRSEMTFGSTQTRRERRRPLETAASSKAAPGPSAGQKGLVHTEGKKWSVNSKDYKKLLNSVSTLILMIAENLWTVYNVDESLHFK